MKWGKEPQISMEKQTQTTKAEMPKATLGGKERNSRGNRGGVSSSTVRRVDSDPKEMQMMETVVRGENMEKALRRVEKNKGSAGTDNRTVKELRFYLKEQWPRIREELLNDKYKPQAVLRVEIPKPNGGVRQLGIPTVVDRLIQQALHQVLSPIFDSGFFESSYGFRQGQKAHSAVKQAQKYVAGGRRGVIDIDLKKFFDRVNHDRLMARVAWKRKFLGCSMTSDKQPRLRVAAESIRRLKSKLKEIFRKGRGQNIVRFIKENLNSLLKGWANYFCLSEVKWIFKELDGWIRRKLRCVQWRQWKRSWTRMINLIKRGLKKERARKSAFNGRGPWWNSGASHRNQAFPTSYFDKCGLVKLRDYLHKL